MPTVKTAQEEGGPAKDGQGDALFALLLLQQEGCKWAKGLLLSSAGAETHRDCPPCPPRPLCLRSPPSAAKAQMAAWAGPA